LVQRSMRWLGGSAVRPGLSSLYQILPPPINGHQSPYCCIIVGCSALLIFPLKWFDFEPKYFDLSKCSVVVSWGPFIATQLDLTWRRVELRRYKRAFRPTWSSSVATRPFIEVFNSTKAEVMRSSWVVCDSVWAWLLQKWWADFIETNLVLWLAYQSEELIMFSWWSGCE